MTRVTIIELTDKYNWSTFIMNVNDVTYEMEMWDIERDDDKLTYNLRKVDPELDSWFMVNRIANFAPNEITVHNYSDFDTVSYLQGLLNFNVVMLDEFVHDRLDVMISEFQKEFPFINIENLIFEQCVATGGEC